MLMLRAVMYGNDSVDRSSCVSGPRTYGGRRPTHMHASALVMSVTSTEPSSGACARSHDRSWRPNAVHDRKELRALDVPEEWIPTASSVANRLKRAVSLPNAPSLIPTSSARSCSPWRVGAVAGRVRHQHPFHPALLHLERTVVSTSRMADLLRQSPRAKASVVTDHIRCFVEDGMVLVSGQTLKADIIVSATGIELCGLGDIAFTIDGHSVSISDTWTYRGIMLSDMPNLAWIFGYIRSSWTLRTDLVARFVCRLLRYMDDGRGGAVHAAATAGRPGYGGEALYRPRRLRARVHAARGGASAQTRRS